MLFIFEITCKRTICCVSTTMCFYHFKRSSRILFSMVSNCIAEHDILYHKPLELEKSILPEWPYLIWLTSHLPNFVESSFQFEVLLICSNLSKLDHTMPLSKINNCGVVSLQYRSCLFWTDTQTHTHTDTHTHTHTYIHTHRHTRR